MHFGKRFLASLVGAGLAVSLLGACESPDPVEPERYAATDRLVQLMNANLSRSARLKKIAEIDHSRLGQDASSPMPPSTVLIFSDPALEARLIQFNPLAALEMPLRVLVFEQEVGGPARVIWNSFDYLVSRYEIDSDAAHALRSAYESGIAEVTRGVPDSAITSFPNDVMQPDGIITIPSPYGFDETLRRVNATIDAQDDTMHFGKMDFQASAGKQGIDIAPSRLILFGAPGPGGRIMAGAITLGLDGFCQKFLVWQDAQGRTYLSFNDLVALADRQALSKSIVLRLVNFRLQRTFRKALATD